MHEVCSAGSCESYMQSNFSLVTVVITTYGDCTPLPRAIESVLRQTYKNIELIVVDDNGVNGPHRASTEAVMARYADNPQISYIRHDVNQNGAAARNTGIKHARGQYISFLDNDDFMLRDRIANAVRKLEDSDADAVFCDVLVTRKGLFSRVCTQKTSGLIWKDLLYSRSCMGTGSNIFLRRSVIDKTGLFDTSFQRRQDIEYMLRVLLRHESVWLHSLDLVKGESATNNEQAYEAYIQTEQHFDKTFKDEIAMLDESERTRHLIDREKISLLLAIHEGNLARVEFSFDKLNQLGQPEGRLVKLLTRARCKQGPFITMVETVAKRLKHLIEHLKALSQIDSPKRAEIALLVSWSDWVDTDSN